MYDRIFGLHRPTRSACDSKSHALTGKWGKTGDDITEKDVTSAALYPKVFDEYRAHVAVHSALTAKLSSNAFFFPLEEDEEVEVEIERGKMAVIKFKVSEAVFHRVMLHCFPVICMCFGPAHS
eukprot:scaffold123928_cov34-Prasinocladus_malaysianus.AAC.1